MKKLILLLLLTVSVVTFSWDTTENKDKFGEMTGGVTATDFNRSYYIAVDVDSIYLNSSSGIYLDNGDSGTIDIKDDKGNEYTIKVYRNKSYIIIDEKIEYNKFVKLLKENANLKVILWAYDYEHELLNVNCIGFIKSYKFVK